MPGSDLWWRPWADPDPQVVLTGGPSPVPCDDMDILSTLPESRPAGFTTDPRTWTRRCARCDRKGYRGFTRDRDRWVCAHTDACRRRNG